jgi:hypothetical protein
MTSLRWQPDQTNVPRHLRSHIGCSAFIAHGAISASNFRAIRIMRGLAVCRRMAINRGGSLLKTGMLLMTTDQEIPMKLVLTLLGVVLLVVAAVYVLVPADQLPGFFPGHEDGVARVHMKHGMASGVAGIVLLAAGIWMGRR